MGDSLGWKQRRRYQYQQWGCESAADKMLRRDRGGGGGGGQPNPQPENTRYCEVFADALARLVEKNIHKIAASVDIGLYLADWTYYYSYIEKQTDIAHWGFKPDLSVSGQGSDLLRHITLSSSSILLDGIGLASGFDDIRNKYQAANAADPDRRGEALASLAGNAVGRGVGYAMKNRIGQLMTPGQLRARFSVTPMQQLVHHVAYGTEGL